MNEKRLALLTGGAKLLALQHLDEDIEDFLEHAVNHRGDLPSHPMVAALEVLWITDRHMAETIVWADLLNRASRRGDATFHCALGIKDYIIDRLKESE